MEGVLDRKLNALEGAGTIFQAFINISEKQWQEKLSREDGMVLRKLKHCDWNIEAIMETASNILTEFQFRPELVWHSMMRIEKIKEDEKTLAQITYLGTIFY